MSHGDFSIWWWLSLSLSSFFRGVIPRPNAVQSGEGYPIDGDMRPGDPSLRLKSGSAQDDATNGNSSWPLPRIRGPCVVMPPLL